MYLLLPSMSQTPRQTHRCTNMYDTPHLFTKFQPCNPTQLKATLILSNFGDHPLPNSNGPLTAVTLATSCTPPSTLVCKTSPLKD